MNTKKVKKGFALIYALSISALFLIFMAWSTNFIINSLKDSKQTFQKINQSENVAKAGLEAAFIWFSSRQNIVNHSNAINEYKTENGGTYDSVKNDVFPYASMAFNPKHDENINDSYTSSAEIGLVKDFPIDKQTKVYGRYEVWRYKDPDNIPSGSPGSIDDYINKNYKEKIAVKDITHLKKNVDEGDGSIWRVVSKGIVYIRNDETVNSTNGLYEKKYNEPPNIVLNSAYVSSEIQRMYLKPINSAVLINNGSKVSIGSDDIIAGGFDGSAGIVYKQYAPSSGVTNKVDGNNKSEAFSSFYNGVMDDISVDNVFGVSEEELKGMADQVVESVDELSVSKVNGSLGSMSIVYIDSPSNKVVFDNSRSLKGGGILFVNGDLKLDNNSGSYYSGIVYVKGNIEIGGTCLVSGAVVLEGTNSELKVVSSNDVANLEFSRGIISSISKKLSKYRVNSLSSKVLFGK